MNPKLRLLLPALALTLTVTSVRGLSPDVSFWQQAVSPEPSGEFENSQDAQVAVAGQTVHLSYFSVVTSDGYNSANTNRLYYRRSVDGGKSFEPAVLLSDGSSWWTPDRDALLLPAGTWRQMAVDGDTLHILAVRTGPGGPWPQMLDYFRSTNGGASFEMHTNLVVNGAGWPIDHPAVVAGNGAVTIAYSSRYNDSGHSTSIAIMNSTNKGEAFQINANIAMGAQYINGGSLEGLVRSGDNIGVIWKAVGYLPDFSIAGFACAAVSTNGGRSFDAAVLSGTNSVGNVTVNGFTDLHAKPNLALMTDPEANTLGRVPALQPTKMVIFSH